MDRPLILITNDDGYLSPGITILSEIAKEFGDVIVLAPDKVQSGQSSALTVEVPVRVSLEKESKNYKLYKCSGKPADCVKLALNKIVHRTPDILLSGINHGSNASLNVIYSGTIAAALEGAIVGIPSIGFSITSHDWSADFTPGIPFYKQIIADVLRNGLPNYTCLNVNIPTKDIKGIKICRQSKGVWQKEFMEQKDPRGQKHYWLTGEYVNTEPKSTDTDIWALNNGYISIVPIQCDMTNHSYLEILKSKY